MVVAVLGLASFALVLALIEQARGVVTQAGASACAVRVSAAALRCCALCAGWCWPHLSRGARIERDVWRADHGSRARVGSPTDQRLHTGADPACLGAGCRPLPLQYVLEVHESNVKRGSTCYETCHTVVLAYGESARDIAMLTRILTQLCAANRAAGGGVVVVLTQQVKEGFGVAGTAGGGEGWGLQKQPRRARTADATDSKQHAHGLSWHSLTAHPCWPPLFSAARQA